MQLRMGKVLIEVNGLIRGQISFTGSSTSNNPLINEGINANTALQLNQNDVVRIYVVPKEVQPLQTYFTGTVTFNQKIESNNLEIDLKSIDEAVTDGSLITMGKMLPTMTCKDFLNGIMNMFNLHISEPNIMGVCKIEPFDDFYNNDVSTYWDITELIDHSRPIELKPTGNELNGYIDYNYKASDERAHILYESQFEKKYGNRTIVNESFYSTGTKTNELPFGCICPENYNDTIILPVYINESGKQNKGVPKIVFWNGLKDCDNWYLKKITTSEAWTLAQYPMIHHLDDFDNPTFDLNYIGEVITTTDIPVEHNVPNLFTTYIQNPIMELLDKHGRHLTCYLNINEKHIQERNLAHFAVIENVLFRIQKLGEFDAKSNTTTKIELIKKIK